MVDGRSTAQSRLTSKTRACSGGNEEERRVGEGAPIRLRGRPSALASQLHPPLRMRLGHGIGRAILYVATTSGATFTVLVAGGSGTLEVWTNRLTYDAMAVVSIAVWLLFSTLRPQWLPSSRMAPAIAACLAAFAAATVTSRVPRLSAEMFGYAILLAEVYLLLVALMRRQWLRTHFERMALVLCLVVCELYLLSVFQAWQVLWGAVGHLTIPPLRPAGLGLSLGSPNPVATLVLLLAAFALATHRLPGRPGQVVSAVVVALVVATTVITGSRGAWIGAIAGLVACAVAMTMAAPRTGPRVMAFLHTRRGATAAVAAAVIVLAGGALAYDSHRLTLGDDGYRAAFAAASLRMFEASPLVGVGPGVWQVLRASYETATQPDLYIPHAHDIYLQTLAEFGVVGVLAGLVVVGSFARLLGGAIRSDDGARRRVGVATLFGVVLLAGQQLVDMLMNVPALLLALAIPLAWLDAAAEPPTPVLVLAQSTDGAWAGQKHEVGRARLLTFGMVAVTLVVAAGLLRIESISDRAIQSAQEADAGRWAVALRMAEDAAASDPGMPSYWFEVGVTAANAGDLTTAADALGRSAGADDYSIAWIDLAAVRWQQGDALGARSSLLRAERLGWQRVPVAVAAGWLRWQLGDRSEAIKDYGAAVVAEPTLANDPFWNSDADLKAAWPAILDSAEQQVSESAGSPADHARVLFKISLLGGNPSAARAELAPLSDVDRSFYEQVVAAWQGLPGAEATLQQLAESKPQDVDVTWCQLVAVKHDEADLVARYGAWLYMGYAPHEPVARIVLGQPLPQPPGGLDRYGSLYRRPVASAQVIDVLPQISFQDHF
jgi:O-antigen ligase/tetratricopeptide (TPR) repeat protein